MVCENYVKQSSKLGRYLSYSVKEYFKLSKNKNKGRGLLFIKKVKLSLTI